MALSEESFLPDGSDCAETRRQLRWPDGPECVECGSSEVAVRTTKYRDHLYRYECEECGRWFTDTSGTLIENANVDLPVWVYVIREMDKGRSINSIAKDLPHTYKTVRRLAEVIRKAIYERREDWIELWAVGGKKLQLNVFGDRELLRLMKLAVVQNHDVVAVGKRLREPDEKNLKAVAV